MLTPLRTAKYPTSNLSRWWRIHHGGENLYQLTLDRGTNHPTNSSNITTINYEPASLVTGNKSKLCKLVIIYTWCSEKVSAL